jgi:glycosyltransferase involved in cell wall biosynthesis
LPACAFSSSAILCSTNLSGAASPGFHREELDRLTGDCTQIELRKPLPYAEMLPVIERAMVVAHTTQTEGMGRVLLEAMAAGVPCVASEAGGIPYYIKHGENGLLARTGDVADLAEKLRLLLADAGLRQRLAANGSERVRREFTEALCGEHFVEMISRTVDRHPYVPRA